MKSILCLLLLVGCVTPTPPPIVIDDPIPTPVEPAPQPEIDTSNCDALPEADKTFCDEVDACHATYRLCKEQDVEQKCFNKQETCVITSYRKWKKATGAK